METTPPEKRTKGISPIWILPVLALVICIWIVYTSFRDAGIPIDVYFEDASGITPGKTQVVIRGIPIGLVTEITPELGNRRVKVSLEMEKSVADQLLEDTLFWVVRPQISTAGIQGLDTLLGGSYIGMQPGRSSISSRRFTGVSSEPPISEDTPGLHLKLRANSLGSIQAGSEVYFHNIAIGSVTNTSLNGLDSSVLINLYIKQEYAHLVHQGSRFCNASGLSLSGKLTNLKVHFESLSSLLKGGIVLYTPEELKNTPQAESGQTFTLYKDLESAQYGINMTLQLASSVDITEGETKVIYRGMVAGFVKKIEINHDDDHTVTANIMLDPRAQTILRSGTKFWIVRPTISTNKIDHLDTLLSGPYITFMPGNGPFKNHFEILPEPPPQRPLRPGSELLLTAENTYNIAKGAPVSYKNKKVGEVLDVELDDTNRNFEILIFIYEPYEKLVKPHSVFWNNGGISINATLSGVSVKTNSLISSIQGGIAFITPERQVEYDESWTGVVFLVHENYERALAVSKNLHPQGLRFQLTSNKEGSIKKGSPIFYKNIEVGKVESLHLSQDSSTLLLDCFIEKKYMDTINTSSRFYSLSGVRAEGNLQGVSLQTGPLETIISGGIGYFTPQPKANKKLPATTVLYQNRQEAENLDKISVFVRFKDCENLQKGSPVKYKGVIIGKVFDLQFAENMDEINVHLLIHKEAESFFRKETLIWLENAKVSFSGVKNLKTILFGSFINIFPGKGGIYHSFTASTSPPHIPAQADNGLNVVLQSRHLGSVKINSPVYYRQVKIGKVIHYTLSENFQHVFIKVNIEDPYTNLIHENSKFWCVSGARIEGGLFSGITVSTASMEALLTGGIAIATPNNEVMGKKVEEGHHFALYDSAEPEWLDWRPDITVIEKEDQKGSLPEPFVPTQ